MHRVPLSVVIASHNASGVITRCLEALERQASAGLEIIVADSSADDTPAIIERRFPFVRLLRSDRPLSVPALRGRGIAEARGNVVAILDPFSVAAEDWATQVIAAHNRLQHRVIGGSVELHQPQAASYAAWVTYLNEYALFMPPIERGATWIVPGSNVSYKRAALFDGDTARYPTFWKTFVNQQEQAAGLTLWLEPDIRVELNKPIALGNFLRTRFDHGRCFAGLRVREASWLTRFARAGSTVLVPLLQLWRWTAAFWPKRRHRGRFIATLPAQFALFVMWSLGEAVGYLFGAGWACEQTYY